MKVPAASERPRIPAGLRLQWEEAQQAHVLLYPEGMVKLNASAGAILERCDGTRTVGEIIAELETRFGAADLGHDVSSFIALALEKRWLELAP